MNSRSGHTVTEELYSNTDTNASVSPSCMLMCYSNKFLTTQCFKCSPQNIGIDWDGPVPLDLDCVGVIVPETRCPLRDSEYAQLQSLCSLSRTLNSNFHGVDVYIGARRFTQHHANRSLNVLMDLF